MNGNFAPMLRRRPKDAGLPIDGHGVPSASKGYDEQVPAISRRSVACRARAHTHAGWPLLWCLTSHWHEKQNTLVMDVAGPALW